LECFEIYNDELFDLTSKKSTQNGNKKLVLRESGDKLLIENLKKKEIKSLEDFNVFLKKCLKNRSVLFTKLNKNSSRSHCVYKINVVFELKNDD
jgi:hypothetical protein